MKKIFSLLLVFAMLFAFASCGGKDNPSVPEITINCTDSIGNIYLKISEEIPMEYEKFNLTANDMIDYYGIKTEKISEMIAVQDACGYKDEIVMIKANDSAAAEEIADLLGQHIAYQKDSMKDYDAEQYKILTSSIVDIKGEYVAMFISASQDKMLEIYDSYFTD